MSDIVVRVDTFLLLLVARLPACAGPSWAILSRVVFDFDCAPGDDGATLRDAGRRGVPRAKNLSHRNQTRARTGRDVTRTETRRRVSRVCVRACIAAQPPEARGTLELLKGGKTANHDSWGDACRVNIDDDDVCVDVGAGAKRSSRDVVATARGRPRDAKRFVSFVQRERERFASTRRDANVGDGAERGGSGPDRWWWLQARRRAEDGW